MKEIDAAIAILSREVDRLQLITMPMPAEGLNNDNRAFLLKYVDTLFKMIQTPNLNIETEMSSEELNDLLEKLNEKEKEC